MPLIASPEIQERLHLVFENAPIGMLVGDTSNRLSQTNKALREMLGYRADELACIDMAELVHRDDRLFSKKLFAELLSGKRDSSQLEERYLHKDGHDVWCKADVALVRDSLGHPQLFICMLEDISERKHAEASLQRMVRQYEQILNTAGWGICGVDRHGRVAFLNPEASRMLAWSADELIAQPVRVIAQATGGTAHFSEISNAVAAALRDGLIRHSDHDMLVSKGGSSFPVEYTVTPLVEAGVVNGAVILFMDITRHVESMCKMQACMDTLMQLNETLIAAQRQSPPRMDAAASLASPKQEAEEREGFAQGVRKLPRDGP